MQENKSLEVKEELDLLKEDTLKAKYGRVIKINVELEEMGEDLTFYFKAPNTSSFSRYIKNASKNSYKLVLIFHKKMLLKSRKKNLKMLLKTMWVFHKWLQLKY